MWLHCAKCWPQTSQREGISAQAQYHATQRNTTFGLELAHIHPTQGKEVTDKWYFSGRLLSHILVVSPLKTQQLDTQLSVTFPFIHHYFGDEHYAFIQKYSSFPFFTGEKMKMSSCATMMTGTTVSSVRNFYGMPTPQLSKTPSKLKAFCIFLMLLQVTIQSYKPHLLRQYSGPASVYKWWQVEYSPLRQSNRKRKLDRCH